MKQNQSFMGWLLLCLHLFLFQFSSLCYSSSSSSFNFLCHHDESSALLQFKSSFSIDGYARKTKTWKYGTDCCSWHGVTCDTVSGHIIGLNLGWEGLEGIIHSNSTLFLLVHLQTLDLSSNYFSDSHFHSKFGGFLNLTHLDLSDNSFEGEVPPQISHLSKLKSLHLSENDNLVWKETTLKRLVKNTTNLRELILDETNMSSIRPNSIEFLFNQSSSLIALNLGYTGLSGKFEKITLCLPSIQELDMSLNNLEGQLPDLRRSTSLSTLDLSFCQFQGPIPLSFSNLTRLNSLNLSGNNLNGSILSSHLTLLTLPYLAFLDLSDNELSGGIPSVFNLSNKFQELNLRGNKIRGELPTSLSNLQHLINLDLSLNSFSGQIPYSLFNLTQLVYLDFSHNKLEGGLPNKITSFKLTDFHLNDNCLNGTIPPSLLSLPYLEVLDLSNNQLSRQISEISSYSLARLYLCGNKLHGNIPESIFNLDLTGLCLSSNNLSGVVNFQNFSKLQRLKFLSLSKNSQLSLNFESSVHYNISQLSELDLSSLSLIVLPNLSGKVPGLQYLDLSNNKMSGGVPNWLYGVDTGYSHLFVNLSQNLFTSMDQFSRNLWQDIDGLDLSYNLLADDISLSICNASGLLFLSLANNQLKGTIPQCLSSLSSLKVLDLQMNQFHGTLPSNFSKESELHTLNLFRNRLEGHLPKSLSHCKNLEVLNIGNNKIEGNFPYWFQTMQSLKVLVLRDNKFHGPIVNLVAKHPFPSLIIFDISGNNFSGPLPKDYLNKFEAMKNVTEVGSLSYIQIKRVKILFNDGVYYDSVTVTMKGINMPMVKILRIFVSIDLSRNKFEGEIPNVIGELHNLIGLNLSHNMFIGPIPRSIGNLTNLEWLDLSSNMLTGLISAKLTNLNNLEVLNLSHNHLVGEIPQGKQFNTFTNDSYEGNLGLCGFPLSKNCGPEQHSPPSANNFWSEEKLGFGWKPVAIGYGCGFVFGIGLGYCMFLIGKPRWLVKIFGGHPKQIAKTRQKIRRNTMVQP